jgi:hypothetical protein
MSNKPRKKRKNKDKKNVKLSPRQLLTKALTLAKLRGVHAIDFGPSGGLQFHELLKLVEYDDLPKWAGYGQNGGSYQKELNPNCNFRVAFFVKDDRKEFSHLQGKEVGQKLGWW